MCSMRISLDARRHLSIDIRLHIGECVWANPFTFYKISFNFWHFFEVFWDFQVDGNEL